MNLIKTLTSVHGSIPYCCSKLQTTSNINTIKSNRSALSSFEAILLFWSSTRHPDFAMYFHTFLSLCYGEIDYFNNYLNNSANAPCLKYWIYCWFLCILMLNHNKGWWLSSLVVLHSLHKGKSQSWSAFLLLLHLCFCNTSWTLFFCSSVDILGCHCTRVSPEVWVTSATTHNQRQLTKRERCCLLFRQLALQHNGTLSGPEGLMCSWSQKKKASFGLHWWIINQQHSLKYIINICWKVHKWNIKTCCLQGEDTDSLISCSGNVSTCIFMSFFKKCLNVCIYIFHQSSDTCVVELLKSWNQVIFMCGSPFSQLLVFFKSFLKMIWNKILKKDWKDKFRAFTDVFVSCWQRTQRLNL